MHGNHNIKIRKIQTRQSNVLGLSICVHELQVGWPAYSRHGYRALQGRHHRVHSRLGTTHHHVHEQPSVFGLKNRAGHALQRQSDHVFRPQSCYFIAILLFCCGLLQLDTETNIFFEFFSGPWGSITLSRCCRRVSSSDNSSIFTKLKNSRLRIRKNECGSTALV